MFGLKNLTEWKSTLLGLVVLGAGLAYPFIIENTNIWIFSFLMVVGISLLFLPNEFLSSLKRLIKANSEKKF